MPKSTPETKAIIFDILSKALDSTDLSQTDYISLIEDKMCYNFSEYENFRMTEPKMYIRNPKRKITIYRRYQAWLIDVLPTQRHEQLVKVLGTIIKKSDRVINYACKYLQKKSLKDLDISI